MTSKTSSATTKSVETTAAPVETADSTAVEPTLPFELETDPTYTNSTAKVAVGDRVWVRYQRIMRPGTITALPDDKGRVLVKFDFPFNNEVRSALELVFSTGDKSGTLSI